MTTAIGQLCLRSPIRRLASLKDPRTFSTSLVHNDIMEFKDHDDFVKKVFVTNDFPVIVDFHADWCQPCKILTNKLKKEIRPLKDLSLVVVNVEDNIDLVNTFEVKAVPAILAVKNGLVVNKFIGLVSTDVIKRLISQLSGKKAVKA